MNRIFCEGLTRARKERQIAPQASAGYPLSINSLLAFRKKDRGWEKKASMKGLNTPATAKEEYLPHDYKQYGFPSATLKSLDIQNRSVPWPATNLEMIHSCFKYSRKDGFPCLDIRKKQARMKNPRPFKLLILEPCDCETIFYFSAPI